MRTTIDLPTPLYLKVKSTATARGLKMKEFIQAALTSALKDQQTLLPDLEDPQLRHQRLMREHFQRMDAARPIHDSVSTISRDSLHDRHA
jgi:hypothetical protein